MKTLQSLTLLTALAAAMLASSPAESSAQSTNDFQVRYRVSLKHPLANRWLQSGTYSSRYQAERREDQLEREYWVIYHREGDRKRFRSATSRRDAHELMWRLKGRGYCVSRERKFARVFRTIQRVVYTVRDYHPLTGRVRSTRTFRSSTQARRYYNQLRAQYWIIIKKRFGGSKYLAGGSKRQATLKAAALNVLPGQKAYPKRRSVRMTKRVES